MKNLFKKIEVSCFFLPFIFCSQETCKEPLKIK